MLTKQKFAETNTVNASLITPLTILYVSSKDNGAGFMFILIYFDIQCKHLNIFVYILGQLKGYLYTTLAI